MALDACVYCDCFERGKVRTPPPQPTLVVVDERGSLSLSAGASETDWDRFDEWCKNACEHSPSGQLVSHWLGNISRVEFLRCQLRENARNFPVLLDKVIYDAVHCGDFLTLSDVRRVALEMEGLKEIRIRDRQREAIIREFETQIRELVTASLKVGKPIAF